MTRAHRTLWLAIAASCALHLAVLGGVPAFELGRGRDAPSPPLDVHLVAAPPAPPVAASEPAAPKKGPRVQRRAPRTPQPAAAPMPAPAPIEPAATAADVAPISASGAEASAGGPDVAASGEASPATEAGRAAPAADFGTPAPYPIRRLSAVYDLFYNGEAPDAPVGRVTHVWSTDGERYVAESVAEGVGLVSLFYGGKFAQRSEGRIGAEGLVPDRYTLRRGGAAISDEARFDWETATAALASKGETRIVAIARGAQDPLSALHQFYFIQPLAASGRFSVADGRRLRTFWYELVGEELVETALGVVNALHMRRADGDNASAEVWVDPRRSYLPVKILATDRKGRVIAQHIRSLEVEPVATAAVGGASR